MPLSPYELTLDIQRYASELCFDKIGIAKVKELRSEAEHLHEWLSHGYHGSMQWMETSEAIRTDPTKIVPDAKSIIVVAVNYYTDIPHVQNENIGKISRYAWGGNYHELLIEPLHKLMEFIKSIEPSAEGKAYVDTGPVMEKVWAQRAGLGWEGKHTNLITHDYGSWIFLGELIVNIELEYNQTATDHCGSCTLCIEACPTSAIVEPYVIDSNRCISYLTIEHRGEVDEKLSEKLNQWIYGCDICQEVCPWNKKFSKPTHIEEFYPRGVNIAPNLEEICKMSKEEFNANYKGSPIKRTKYSGFIRNASNALSLYSI